MEATSWTDSTSEPRSEPQPVSAERCRVQLPTGTSGAVREVIGLIRQVADFDSTVLILGESGTGKEVAAHAVHDLSPRRHRPFVAVNCGAIPADLLESELFGHEKGAFTGAIASRKGRFEIAEGGTLFLDEIGDMSPNMQVKLLRVLQERVFERIGNHTPIHCDVRIIAATHRNLEESIRAGTFREDLFHRLNVFPIEMPALRSRLEDLPLLVRDFIARNIAEGRGEVQLAPRVLTALGVYRWPGNVRELANLIERLSIVCRNRTATLDDLPNKYQPVDWTHASPMARWEFDFDTTQSTVHSFEIHDAEHASHDVIALPPTDTAADNHHPALPTEGLDLRLHLLEIERQLVLQALERADGVVAHAARLLNVRRTTLIEKLRKLGIDGGKLESED
jgi:sigma-54 dependent transcriptional regulator, flagellar regulatory protein